MGVLEVMIGPSRPDLPSGSGEKKKKAAITLWNKELALTNSVSNASDALRSQRPLLVAGAGAVRGHNRLIRNGGAASCKTSRLFSKAVLLFHLAVRIQPLSSIDDNRQ